MKAGTGRTERKVMRRPMTIDKAMQRIERIPFAGCWLWTGNVRKDGYGTVITGGGRSRPTSTGAHRFFYEQLVGQIPDGMRVCHRCDVTCCVNPAHLFVGTDADNCADKIAKGRFRSGVARGEKQGNSRLTSSQILAIRLARASGQQLKAIGERFGIKEAHVCRIAMRKAWKHI